MRNLFFAVAIFICGVAHATVAVAQQASNGDQKQQVRERVKSALQTARDGVKVATINLNVKVEAQKLLADDSASSMSGDLVDGLTVELKLIQLLQKADSVALEPLIDAETSLVNNDGQFSTEEVGMLIDKVNEGFGVVEKGIRSRSESRREFKKRLNSFVDALISASPAKTPGYRWIKSQLDPDQLDLQFALQKTILVSLIVNFNSLK